MVKKRADIYEIIDMDELKKHEKDFEDWVDYIPLLLIGHIYENPVPYYHRWTKEARIKYQKTRQGLPGDLDKLDEYLKNDIYDWVKQYPQFENILIK